MSCRILSTLFLLLLAAPIAMAQPPQDSKPEDPPTKSRRITVSDGVLQGNAINKVQPPYPPIAKDARASGAVQVQVTISEDGDVIEAFILSGHPLLRDVALTAAKQWTFKPTEPGGVPVKMQGVLTFNFTLDKSYAKEPTTDHGLPGGYVVPRAAMDLLYLGKDKQMRGDLKGAIADYTKAIEIAPEFVDAYSERSIARIEAKDLEGGIADANKIIELNPRNAVAYLTRGSLRMLKLDLDGSVADLSKAIELNPQSSYAWFFRGIARMNQGDLDSGLADLGKAIELAPQSALFCVNHGLALLLQGKEAEAQKDFDRALKLDPGMKYFIEEQTKALKEQHTQPERRKETKPPGASKP